MLPLIIIAFVPIFAFILAVETFNLAFEVGHLVDVAVTLAMGEAPSSPIPTKRDMDEDLR